MSYRLVFVDKNEVENFVADVDTEQAARKAMFDYLAANKPLVRVYYMRSWKQNNYTTYDYGSWSEFFRLYDEV